MEEKIKKIFLQNHIWNDNYKIVRNKRISGQSQSYFVENNEGVKIFIIKFFDYLKGISIPDSINADECGDVDELVDKLADSDEFIGEIDKISTFLYYQKRSFNRYIEVALGKDSVFPKVYVYNDSFKIRNRFYGYLVEEVIKGETLEEYLKEDKIGCRKEFAINFLWEMCLLIEKFIKHGIVHRDISPDNIIFNGETFIIIDPGMVKYVDRNTTVLGCQMGKSNYASPEQYFGCAVKANFTSDLYSIGLITFQIVSGINPLESCINRKPTKPHEELLNKFDRDLEDIFFSKIDDSEKSHQLYMIIHKLLQVEKIYRFDNINSLKEAIQLIREE